MVTHRGLGVAAMLAAAVLIGTPGSVHAGGAWAPAGSLNIARTAFAATSLGDGSVLVAGGSPGSIVGHTAERYDPAANLWTQTGDLVIGRSGHTLSPLPDGRALAAGGNSATGLQRSAELFDPASATWSLAAPMLTARANHSATVLGDGRVLIAGGVATGGGATNEVEVYDPASGSWSRVASLRNPRYNHSATLLADGRVLVAGGFTPGSFHTPSKTAEVYDPATDRWNIVGTMDVPRAVHAATLLTDGRVLVAGGVTSPVNVLTVTASAEIWDPATERWTRTEDLGTPRRAIDANRLADGTVLIAGGFDSSGGLTGSSEIYDPSNGHWRAAASLSTPRAPVTAVLADGRVLAIASIGRVSTTDVEVYSP